MEEPGKVHTTDPSPDNTSVEQSILTPTDKPVDTSISPSWQYNDENSMSDGLTASHGNTAISWTASEFIQHDKAIEWFLGLGGAIFTIAALVYVLTNDALTTGAILITGVLFGIVASRKPKTLNYHIDEKGIRVGEKLYEYERFKSFSVIPEGVLNSIHLMPLGRVVPPLSLYYPPNQEEQIVATLADYLPHEERTHDPVDRLMRRIRF